MSNRTRLHARVYGLVQGVNFRAFVSYNASALGLAGYARNLSDGSVEVEAEGDKKALEKLVKLLNKGPSRSRVERVDVDWSEAQGEFSGFEVF